MTPRQRRAAHQRSTAYLQPSAILRRGKNPSIAKTRCPQFPYEELQCQRFARNTSRHLLRMQRCYIDATVEQLLNQLHERLPTAPQLELVNTSQYVLDRDSNPLIIFLKRGLTWPLCINPTRRGLDAILKFITKSAPPAPKADDVRHNQFIQRDGAGVHHLAFWHAVGRETSSEAVISNDIRSAAYRLNATIEFMNDFTPITQAVGSLLELVDAKVSVAHQRLSCVEAGQLTEHQNYDRYTAAFRSYANSTAVKLIQTTHRNCFLGMALLTNLQCGPHRDMKDTLDGWVADMAFGSFSGGHLQVPQTGRQFQLEPGDVIFMRSHILQHSVSGFTGDRYGVVMFTHSSVMPKESSQRQHQL